MSEKEYLGDGVYVEEEFGAITLTTENGISVTNRIVLEPQVYGALLLWVERLSTPKEGKGT